MKTGEADCVEAITHFGDTEWRSIRMPDLTPFSREALAQNRSGSAGEFELGCRRVQSQRQDRRQVGPPLSARTPQRSSRSFFASTALPSSLPSPPSGSGGGYVASVGPESTSAWPPESVAPPSAAFCAGSASVASVTSNPLRRSSVMNTTTWRSAPPRYQENRPLPGRRLSHYGPSSWP
jgi:hypothetical protein